MVLTAKYGLSGCANGAPMALRGDGTADPGSGRFRLTLAARRVPLGWDPALVLAIGLDALLLAAAARPTGAGEIYFPDGGLPVLGGTQAELLDDQGREVGKVRSIWHARREGGVLDCRGQLLGATSASRCWRRWWS